MQLTLRGGWQKLLNKSLRFSTWLSFTFNTHGLHLCIFPNARVCVFLAFHNHTASRSLALFQGASTHSHLQWPNDRKSFIFNESWRFMVTWSTVTVGDIIWISKSPSIKASQFIQQPFWQHPLAVFFFLGKCGSSIWKNISTTYENKICFGKS